MIIKVLFVVVVLHCEFYINRLSQLCSTLRIGLNIGIESGDQDAESHAGNLLSLLMLNKTEMQLIALMDFCIVLLIAEGCQL